MTDRPAPYGVVLFDLDHTLLDSAGSEASAFDQTVRSIGLDPTPDLFQTYRTINTALWAKVEQGELTPDQVKVRRFEQFLAKSPTGGSDPVEMAATFAAGLGNNGDLYPGAREVLDKLAGQVTMGLVTNGLSAVQRRRVERLDLARYFASIVISAEVGMAKPDPAIFELAFDQLGHPARAEVLMVGDSLTSDIQGGNNAGIDTCLYLPNPEPASDLGQTGDPAPAGEVPLPTYRIADLADLVPLVLG